MKCLASQQIFLSKVIFLLLTASVVGVSSEYYTSTSGLEDLLYKESLLVNAFENYVRQVNKTHHEIRTFLDDVEAFLPDIDDDPVKFFSDPLNSFRAMRRIVVEWSAKEKSIVLDPHGKEFSTNFTNIISMDNANAKIDDLIGASKGVARLQRTYAIKTSDFADGVLMNRYYDASLSAQDCYALGRSLYEAQQYKESMDWLLQSRMLLRYELEKSRKDGNEGFDENSLSHFPPLSVMDVLEYLAPAMFFVGNYKMAKLLNDELLTLEPDNKHGLQNREIFYTHVRAERSTAVEFQTPKGPSSQEKPGGNELTDAVCRGTIKPTPQSQRYLRCRYVNNNVPFCRIAPFKMEELSLDPFLAIYYDSIHDSEIEHILNATEYSIETSTVGVGENKQFSEIRISKTTWIGHDQYSFMNPILERLKDMTGLSLETAEELQVVNYGIGGHYAPHLDAVDVDVDIAFPGQGNRILTALFYINDVELGGATAFPFLRLAIPPTRGSAVVWYNLHESLELDYRTKHTGCPVLKGSKWICNEWFHQYGQEFLRPCSLEEKGATSLPFKDMPT